MHSEIRYAGFWKRLNAYGYDLLLMQGLTLAVMLLFFRTPTLEELLMQDRWVHKWFSLFTNFYLVFSSLYNILMVASPWQATLGKRFCGTMVITTGGTRLTLLQSTVRHALSGLSMILGGLGGITILFNRQKAALHDFPANTRVILKPKKERL